MSRNFKSISPSRTYMLLCFIPAGYYFVKLTLPEGFKTNDSNTAKFFAMRETDAQVELCIAFEDYSNVVLLQEILVPAGW